MFYRFEINHSWVLSPVARWVYFVSTIMTVTLFASLIGISFALAAAEGVWADVPAVFAFPLVQSLRVGVFGAALLWVAMVYYCYGYDHRSEGARTLSFVAFVVFGPLASLLYYFVVYRSHDRREAPIPAAQSSATRPVFPA